MLSALMHQQHPSYARFLYAPTHQNHPCTRWVQSTVANSNWLYWLMTELDNVRQSLGSSEHQSMVMADIYRDLYGPMLATPRSFIFCGPVFLAIRDCSVPEKYKAYYWRKQQEWSRTKHPMTYKGRSVPPFLNQETI